MNSQNAHLIHTGYGRKVGELRREAQLSQRDLAQIINISSSVLARIETNRRGMSEVELNSIARALNAAPDDLRPTIFELTDEQGSDTEILRKVSSWLEANTSDPNGDRWRSGLVVLAAHEFLTEIEPSEVKKDTFRVGLSEEIKEAEGIASNDGFVEGYRFGLRVAAQLAGMEEGLEIPTDRLIAETPEEATADNFDRIMEAIGTVATKAIDRLLTKVSDADLWK